MAEATAEAHTAPVTDSKPEISNTEKASSGGAEKASNGGDEKVNNGEAKKVHDEDNPERYDSRDKRDNRRDNDRSRGGRDGGRDGGRGRGRGRGNDRARGRGRGGFTRGGSRGGSTYHKKDNVRTNFERAEESSDQTEIRRQVEFYFSESNLPIDRYLLEETGGPENKPFPLKTLHNFKRMRHFQPYSAVVEAVKGSEFLEVNDQDEVYRKEPLDSRFTDDVVKNAELLTSVLMSRSIYAKGFGEEGENTTFEIEDFFNPYGTRSVRLRREQDGKFKGSVFVEFNDVDTAQQFLNMENKPKFNDKELLLMTKKEYVDGKNQDILEGKVIPKSPTRYGGGRFNNNRERRGSFKNDRRGSFQNKRKRDNDDEDDVDDKDDWRQRRDKFQRGGGRGGRDRKDSRSRSRSPYRHPKKEDAKMEDASETKKEDVKTTEAVKTEEPAAAASTETKKDAEETSA